MTPGAFLMCAASVSRNASSQSHSEKLAISRKGSDASAWRPAPFSCALRQCLNASSLSHSEKLAISPKVFSQVMLPLMRSHCYLFATLKGQPVSHGTQLQSRRWTPSSKSRTSIAQGRWLCVCVYTADVWSGEACICSQGRRQHLAHGASTCRSHATFTCISCAWHFYVHFDVQSTA